MEYYSVIKNNEVLKHATTHTNLETTKEGEISGQKRTNIVRLHLYKIPKIGKFIKTESKLVRG